MLVKKLVKKGEGTTMPRYIKAGEAIELLGIPPATFYRWARDGKINKHYPTNNNQRAVYEEAEIKLLREEQGESELEDAYDTDWLTVEDLGSLYDLEYRIYGEETGDPKVVRTWIKRNPYIGRILFSRENRRDLWGAVIFLPICDEPTMIKLVTKDGLRDAFLNPETQILTYNDPGIYDLYAGSVIMKPGREYLLLDLIKSYLAWWVDLAPDKKIGRIWGRVVSGEGELLAVRLQASPLDWLAGKVYRLDLSIPRKLPIIRDFQNKVLAKEKAF